ncbi:helix-turn-helix domain-containing protein [Ligilactobacillus sp. WILCCON 0076]|uniref:Helix-turn-helix domain-containing protein n=1 Tax=Ligilactobacillus ubinensis TaxID=2876789 RepID=A0A9X2FLY1_9LACO|nr:helix-turn-helix domain-containing protein [Ligilactobacillus ubinensis]MCP0887136.1 helix-turn-helix domain-containing protein [Ligilactobacillus ubinensis]
MLIENTKRLLRERGWTQEKLGDEAGLRQETISYLLRGKNIPTLETVDKLSAAFNVTTIELLSDWKLADRTKEPTIPYSAKRKEVVFTKYGKNSKVANVTMTIPNHQEFRDEFIDFNFDKNKPKSGKPSSYANYMEYIFQNYYDNFCEVLDPFDKQSPRKIDKMRNSPNFREYNLNEGRFPNAAIEAYNRFIESK